MVKTLLIMATHFIDENVISEFRKMQNTPNVDALLMINNTECNFEIQSRIEVKNFFGTSVKCFFFDEKLNEILQLSYFTKFDKKNFEMTTWFNGDYRFYYVRKFFPNYDYYWMADYDVFCNGETYAGFLEKFVYNNADLLIPALNKRKKNSGIHLKDIDWAYDDEKNIYVGLFAVVRLSARAIDFLYQKRLEHGKIFQSSPFKNKQWLISEIFVPTELTDCGFTCEDLDEPHVNFLPHIYLNDERIFLHPDNRLYHPVKSVRAEMKKRDKQYADLFLAFRKNFFIQMVENLDSISKLDFKELPITFDEKYVTMSIELLKNPGVGRLRCEVYFVIDEVGGYGTIFQIYSALLFEGEYLNYFETIEKAIDVNQTESFQTFGDSKCKILAYRTETFDNVFQVANITNILIEIAFTILNEKF